MRHKLGSFWTAVIVGALLLTACQPQTVEVVVTQPVEVTRQVDVEVTRQVEVEVTREVEVQATVEVIRGQMRELSGEITVAVEGAVPVPGAPPTKRQQAWQKILGIYNQLQPEVTVNLIDLPAGGTGEQFCETRIASQTMPDISMIGNCDYFRPTPAELAAGTVIATDFMPFQDEINPYTGFSPGV
jgi:ABC-type glycerol-3-phosphate transport system substrate-binding protein